MMLYVGLVWLVDKKAVLWSHFRNVTLAAFG